MRPERLAALRARSQALHRPRGPSDPVEVLRAIGGAQAQEPRAGRLQVRTRSRGLTAAAVERARVEERSLVRAWLMRGTIHLVPADDIGWLAPLFDERTSRWARQRLAQLGISDTAADRALARVRKELASGEPMPRSEMMAVAARTGIEASTSVRTVLSVLLVTEGIACIGPDAGRESTLVATEAWLGPVRRREREAGLTELARRYFRAFAPAGERDFAAWSGLALGECRHGIAAIASELDERRCGAATLLVPRGWSARAPRAPLVRLLGAFDTYLMGYASRAHAVDEEGARAILPGGGVLRPTILIDGRFAGTWSQKRAGERLSITLEPFEPLDDATLEALAAEAADVARFDGLDPARASIAAP